MATPSSSTAAPKRGEGGLLRRASSLYDDFDDLDDDNDNDNLEEASSAPAMTVAGSGRTSTSSSSRRVDPLADPPPETESSDGPEARAGGPSNGSASAASAMTSAATTAAPRKLDPNQVRNSFTADSPYFGSFVERECRSVRVMGEELHNIGARAQTLIRTGQLYGEAARRLATACRLRRENNGGTSSNHGGGNDPDGGGGSGAGSGIDEEEKLAEEEAVLQRQAAMGDEMVRLFSLLSEVLDEVAAAQENMCESLKATIGTYLVNFAETEARTVAILRQQAEEATDQAEAQYGKYLNSKQQLQGSDGSGNPADPNDGNANNRKKGAAGIASSLKSWGKKTLQSELVVVDRRRIGGGRDVSDGSSSGEAPPHPGLGRALQMANLRTSLEQIRLSQATSELNRYRLVQQIMSVKYRRRFELGETILATFHTMNACYQQCGDLVTGYLPKANRIQTEQLELRDTHRKQIVPTWKRRENALAETARVIKESFAEAARLASDVAAAGGVGDGMGGAGCSDPGIIERYLVTVEDVEDRVDLWGVPRLLADSSRYQREPAPGVVMEGWLYKKSSAMISLQPWSRKWFIMDSDEIYYLQSDGSDARRSGSSSASGSFFTQSERVKVCDVVLCTVREIANGAHRFCFELVTPSEKPLTLQARGPLEYRTWVDGIRANTEKQLVHGDPHAETLNKNIGKQRRTKDRFGGTSNTRLANDPDSYDATSSEDNFSEDSEDLGGEIPSPNKPSATSQLVVAVMACNTACADCGMPNPDWASLNLGVLFCIECSAVHRSLGVHVSKVRSLTLDSLSESEARLLLALGNDVVNPIWEGGLDLQKGWTKPTESADRKAREDWIKSKYMWKGFLNVRAVDGLSEEERKFKYSRDLFEACRVGNARGAVDALVHGGAVDWTNPDEGGKTPLHVCALAKRCEGQTWQAIETAEFLLQNGAKLDVLDAASHGVLDCALLGNAEVEMVEFLSSRL